MPKNDKQKTFIEDFLRKSLLDRCPYLYDWWSQKMEEIGKVPTNIPREGTRKGDKIGMPRHKLVLVLWQIIYPGINLKRFAEVFGVSYGTVRNWNIDEGVQAQKSDWIFEFCDLYLSKLYGLIKPKKDNYEKIKEHVAELQFYKNVLCTNQIGNLFLLKYGEWVSAGTFSGNTLSAFDLLSLAILGNKELGDQKSHKIFYERCLTFHRKLLGVDFKNLKRLIKEGNFELANKLAATLESNILEGVMPTWQNLLMKHYDYEHGLIKRKSKR